MAKNVIFIVIDALSFKALSLYPFKDELFLLSDERVSHFDGLYTQGPFTEASTAGLLYGKNSLENGGSMFFGKHYGISIIEMFEQRGYDCLEGSLADGVPHIKNYWQSYYLPHYLSSLGWSRMDHFKSLMRQRPLSRSELECVRDLLEMHLKLHVAFCQNFIDKAPPSRFLENHLDSISVSNSMDSATRALQGIDPDPASIAQHLSGHAKFKIPDIQMVSNAEERIIGKIYDEYRPPLLSAYDKHKSRKKDRLLFPFLISTFMKHGLSRAGLAKMYHGVLDSPHDETKKAYQDLLSEHGLRRKGTISFKTKLDGMVDWISKAKQPYFVYVQPDDYHPRSTFHTYDSDNPETIRNDLSKALSLANRMPKKLKCNIFNMLSIAYIDSQIKDFVAKVEQMTSGLRNTLVVVTSDHGTWELNDIVRRDYKLMMPEERIHTPFFVIGANARWPEKLCNNCSIPNTLLELAGLEDFQEYAPSIMHAQPANYLVSESLGFGCPDLFNRPIIYTIHNKQLKLVIKCMLREDISREKCEALFDLQQDPLETRNLINKPQRLKKYQKNISEMLEICEKRHRQLCYRFSRQHY